MEGFRMGNILMEEREGVDDMIENYILVKSIV